MIRRVSGVIVVMMLVACTSFQPSADQRGINFPLKTCDSETVKRAARDFTVSEPYRISSANVCVTAPPLNTTAAASDATLSEQRAVRESAAFSSQGVRGREAIKEGTREAIERPFLAATRARDTPRFGVALSGGGSKAAAFAMGVLAGVADKQMLQEVDFISSVSGGSYAAYFLYAHLLIPPMHGELLPRVDTLFADCVRQSGPGEVSQPLESKLTDEHSPGLCPWSKDKPWDVVELKHFTIPADIKYQAFSGCQQDVFKPGVCTFKRTPEGDGVALYPVFGTFAFAPFALVSGTLFDWGISLSAAGNTYKNGIGMAFGTTASDAFRYVDPPDQVHIDCRPNGDAMDCVDGTVGDHHTPLTFDDLRIGLLAAGRQGHHLPFWIINATAPRHRSGIGWMLASDTRLDDDIFEMTPLSHGSPRYGYVTAPASLHGMNVLDAVAASAAFLDSNEQRIDQNWRGIAGTMLHLSNLDWGIDIRNYNVSDTRALFHRLLPYPLNLLDGGVSMMNARAHDQNPDRVRSSFLRLIDGGNSEDLGVYSLIKRDVRNIVVSDAAEDQVGKFGDVCRMMRSLQYAPAKVPHIVYVPGLDSFADFCAEKHSRMSYDLHQWVADPPVLLGCVRVEPAPDKSAPCSNLGPHDIRLFIVKPAIDVPRFVSEQWDLRKNLLSGAGTIKNCWLAHYDGSIANDIRQLNCETAMHIRDNWDGDDCLVFPQNTTVGMTANSSRNLYAAYRELARQYTYRALDLLIPLVREDESPESVAAFDGAVDAQRRHAQPLVKETSLTGSCLHLRNTTAQAASR